VTVKVRRSGGIHAAASSVCPTTQTTVCCPQPAPSHPIQADVCSSTQINVNLIDMLALKNQFEDHIKQTAAHGTESDIVGESDEQTLTNKTLDGGYY